MTFDTNVFNAFNENAEKYFQHFQQDSQYHAWYQKFADLINPKGQLLDVGCGPGLFTGYLRSQLPTLQITGIDLSPKMIELAKKHVPKANFKTLNSNNIKSLNQHFHAVSNNFVIPYLTHKEAEELIKNCGKLLNPKGHLMLAWISHLTLQQEVSTSSDGKHKLTMYYHQLDDIKSLLSDLGMTIGFCHQQIEPLSQKTEVCLIAQKACKTIQA